MDDQTVAARIFRFDPQVDDEPHFEVYQVPFQHGMSVLGVLRYVYEELDPTLAFRNYRCGRGICASCRVRVNGRAVKACRTIVEPQSTVTIEPLEEGHVIRDLAVTM